MSGGYRLASPGSSGHVTSVKDDDDNIEPLVDAGEVSRILGLDVSSVRRLARKGELPGSVRVSGRWRFRPDVVRDWIRNGGSRDDEDR